MYIRYTQPPSDLYDWYEEYLQDEEEVDVKAGGGQIMTMGQICRQWLVKLDWFSTLFPRIPVPIQKSIEKRLEEYSRKNNLDNRVTYAEKEMNKRRGEEARDSGERSKRDYYDDRVASGSGSGNGSRSRDYWPSEGREYRDEHDRRKSRSRSRDRYSSRDYNRDRSDRDKFKGERESYKERDSYKERSDYHRSESSNYEAAGSSSSSHKYRDREHERTYR